MDLSVNRAAFVAALKVAATTTLEEAGHAQLSCVLLNADGKTLTVSATNINTTAILQLPCIGKGACVVGARKLLQIVDSLDGQDATLKLDAGTLTVKGQKRKNQIPTVGYPRDYPMLPKVDEMQWQKMPGSVLAEVIEATREAAAQDLARFVFNGVMLQGLGSTLRAVATDGKRMHKAERSAEVTFPQSIVPLAALKVLTSIAEGDIEIAKRDSTLAVRNGSNVVLAKLVDGEYPNLSSHFDKAMSGKRTITFDCRAMADSIHRARMITGKEDKKEGATPVVIRSSDHEAKLSAKNKDGFDCEDAVDVSHEGKAIEIGCNTDYLAAALRALGGDRVTIRTETELDPLMIYRADDYVAGSNPGDFALVMPMRIS